MSVAEPVSEPQLRIDPRLDPEALRPSFERLGRLHIPGFLASDDAERVLRRLTAPQDWTFVFNRGNRHFELTQDKAKVMPAEAYRQLMGDILAEARDGFQLAYDVLNISRKGRVPLTSDPMLRAVHAFLNGRPFLDFIARVTGETGTWADATGTRYGPGHFCEMHNDEADDGDRLIAFVLNLTPKWRVDWGGVLQFVDADGHVAEGYTPAFNALNIFRVPQNHAVSIVAPFAGAVRYSITGWVRR